MLSMRTYDEQPDRDLGITVLIVDDSEIDRLRIESVCALIPAISRTLKTSNLADALEIISKTTLHVVLLDKELKTPQGEQNGIDRIADMLTIQPHLQILMISAISDETHVVRAMREGAFGYVSKKKEDDRIQVEIEKALHMALLKIEKARLEHAGQMDLKNELVGHSPAFRRLQHQLMAVAESNKPVLCEGERGAGKTSAARAIHAYRAKFLKQEERSWFELNLSALGPETMARELFGYEKGAFGGAVRTYQGLIELANNGTLFLDSIGDLTPELQARLLHVLEEGTFRRVGGTKDLRSNFKLICATNKNLSEMVRNGTFGADIYSWITTLTVQVPSLADRKEDIPDIVKHLLPRCCKESNVSALPVEALPQDFIEYLAEFPPPENIKGIEKQICRLLSFSKRDRNGDPTFKRWRSIVDYKKPEASGARNSLSVKELMSLPIDTNTPDFPGLMAVVESVTDRILEDAQKHFRKNKDIAKHVKLSDGAVSVRLRALDAKKEKAKQEMQKCESKSMSNTYTTRSHASLA